MKLTLLQKFLIFTISVMPLMSPIFVEFGWLNISPENMKTAWGVLIILVALPWWIAEQYLKSKELKIKKSLSYYPILLFIVWSFITLFWVEDGYLAIINLAQFLSYSLIFIIIINVFKEAKDSILIIKYLIISMFVVSVIGLTQFYFPDNWIVKHGFMQTSSPGSTFANKNMASHFIVMTLPISFLYLLNGSNKKNTLVFSIAFFIGFWFLINTTARQAYVAIILQTILISLFFLLDNYKNKDKSFLRTIEDKKNKLLFLVVISIGLLFVSNLNKDGWNFNNGIKINNIQRINFESGGVRYPAWANTTEMIKDNPLLGVGIGQWPQAYPLYYDRIMEDKLFNEKSRLQRLHNDFLEIFSNVGLVGFLFLLWLTFLTIRNIMTVALDPENKYRAHVFSISLGLIGFLVVALFSFPVRVYLPAFLVLSYIAIVHIISIKDAKFVTIKSNKVVLIGVIFSAVFSLFFSYQVYKWVKADFHFNNASILSNNKMNSMALVEVLKSLKLNDRPPKSHIKIAELLVKSGELKKAIPYLKKAINISPFHTKALILLSSIYHDTSDFKMERKVLEFILSFDPKNVNALAYLVKNLATHQRGRDSAVVYQRLKKSFEYFKNRPGFGPYHELVGLIATSVGDIEYALYVYTDAVDRFPTAQSYYNLAVIEYDHFGNHSKGILHAKKSLKIDKLFDKEGKIKALIKAYEINIEQ